MELNGLLKLRKQMKRKKPDFVRQDFHKKILRKKWKKPRGLHSKVRLMVKGKPRRISTGFRAPKKVRGLDRSGLKLILVKSLKDITKIEKEGAVIGSYVGLRKRQELLKKLKDMGVKVLNIKDVDAYLKKIEDDLNARKEKKKKLTEKREKKEKPKKEKKLTEKVTEEEKKKEEKKEKDKILTKKA